MLRVFFVTCLFFGLLSGVSRASEQVDNGSCNQELDIEKTVLGLEEFDDVKKIAEFLSKLSKESNDDIATTKVVQYLKVKWASNNSIDSISMFLSKIEKLYNEWATAAYNGNTSWKNYLTSRNNWDAKKPVILRKVFRQPSQS